MIVTLYIAFAIGAVWACGMVCAIWARGVCGRNDIVIWIERWVLKPGGVAVLGAVAALIVQSLVGIATAHESPSGFRYLSSCCSDQDCRPADPGEIVPVSGGWHVVPSNLYVVSNDHRIHESPDGRFHICNVEAGNRKSPFWCIYIPAHGS